MYETEFDVRNAAAVAGELSAEWGCSVVKMKRACVVDYGLIVRDVIAAVMEVKCRNYSSAEIQKMGGLILSAHKMQGAKAWRDTHMVSFVLALGLTDGIFFMSIRHSDDWPKFDLVMGGRYDRGDAQDVEPCVLIPMKNFRKLLKDENKHGNM
jgi:hypothetical protein